MSSALLRFVRQDWLALAFLAVAAFMFLRSPATRVASTQELNVMLADGEPKVEFCSDF